MNKYTDSWWNERGPAVPKIQLPVPCLLEGLEATVMCARTAESDAFGKLTADLGGVRIDEETLDKLKEIASEQRMTPAELVRICLRVRAFGLEHVARVSNDRLVRAVTNVPANDRQNGGL